MLPCRFLFALLLSYCFESAFGYQCRVGCKPEGCEGCVLSGANKIHSKSLSGKCSWSKSQCRGVGSKCMTFKDQEPDDGFVANVVQGGTVKHVDTHVCVCKHAGLAASDWPAPGESKEGPNPGGVWIGTGSANEKAGKRHFFVVNAAGNRCVDRDSVRFDTAEEAKENENVSTDSEEYASQEGKELVAIVEGLDTHTGMDHTSESGPEMENSLGEGAQCAKTVLASADLIAGAVSLVAGVAGVAILATGVAATILSFPALITLTVVAIGIVAWEKHLSAKQLRLKKKYATLIRNIKNVLGTMSDITKELARLNQAIDFVISIGDESANSILNHELIKDADSKRGEELNTAIHKVFAASSVTKSVLLKAASDNAKCMSAIGLSSGSKQPADVLKPLSDRSWKSENVGTEAQQAMCGVLHIKLNMEAASDKFVEILKGTESDYKVKSMGDLCECVSDCTCQNVDRARFLSQPQVLRSKCKVSNACFNEVKANPSSFGAPSDLKELNGERLLFQTSRALTKTSWALCKPPFDCECNKDNAGAPCNPKSPRQRNPAVGMAALGAQCEVLITELQNYWSVPDCCVKSDKRSWYQRRFRPYNAKRCAELMEDEKYKESRKTVDDNVHNLHNLNTAIKVAVVATSGIQIAGHIAHSGLEVLGIASAEVEEAVETSIGAVEAADTGVHVAETGAHGAVEAADTGVHAAETGAHAHVHVPTATDVAATHIEIGKSAVEGNEVDTNVKHTAAHADHHAAHAQGAHHDSHADPDNSIMEALQTETHENPDAPTDLADPDAPADHAHHDAPADNDAPADHGAHGTKKSWRITKWAKKTFRMQTLTGSVRALKTAGKCLVSPLLDEFNDKEVVNSPYSVDTWHVKDLEPDKPGVPITCQTTHRCPRQERHCLTECSCHNVDKAMYFEMVVNKKGVKQQGFWRRKTGHPMRRDGLTRSKCRISEKMFDHVKFTRRKNPVHPDERYVWRTGIVSHTYWAMCKPPYPCVCPEGEDHCKEERGLDLINGDADALP